MGIDIGGSMLVGALGDSLNIPEDEDFFEWIEESGLTYLSLYYDSPLEDKYFGFIVEDIPVKEMDEVWFKKITDLATKFEDITGVKAYLIGSQDVW